MPRLKQSTRRRNLGSAANYFDGDRVAVLRSINVLIAELVMRFGCSVPMERDSSKVGDQRRVLINIDVGEFFGCWYGEVTRNYEGSNHPITTMEWLTRPGKWQELAMKDPKIQTLIAMRRRAESTGTGPKPTGLPSYVLQRYSDRRQHLRGDLVPKEWEYLDSVCRPFVKGTKTPKEREIFHEEDSVPPRPWESEALLALGAARCRGRSSRTTRELDSSSHSRSPRAGTSSRRRHNSRSPSVDSLHSDTTRSTSVDSHGRLRSSSPAVVRRSTRLDRRSRSNGGQVAVNSDQPSTTTHSRSSRTYAFSSPTSRGRDTRSRSSSPLTGSSSRRVLRRNHQSHRSNEGRGVVNPYRAAPSPSTPLRRSSRGSRFSSSFASTSSATSARRSSPPQTLDSDSDLPSMEDLMTEFRPTYSVIALLWLKVGLIQRFYLISITDLFTSKNGDYSEELLMNVTRGSTNLSQQKVGLGRIGVEPEVVFELLENATWRRISRADVFVAPRFEKVYLRAEGVACGHKMPCPDVIEID
ncbi:hypothetical protein K435DRAFT_871446 [Dendrothele bispora CBS 962.96]|uniref:Uncharacterized protein n=1 Tax=Dendrothele bispora (strain CBS 962.96) TaxID=1314807 RepID=A0A4S8L416_DENBC|nr:hypothetical protein K435DRAFT_871446 [Dendrothele bispora CBS 962.96]